MLGHVVRTDGIQPWRLPPETRPFLAPELVNVAEVTSGVRLRFCSDAPAIRLDLTAFEQPKAFTAPTLQFDLVQSGEIRFTVEAPIDQRSVLEFPLSGCGDAPQEIYFPTRSKAVIHGIHLMRGGFLRPAPDQRPHWITYGSSITQCARALHPFHTWPAIAAQRLGWRHTNLGFSGQGKIDPMVARTIARTPCDRISLCLAVNTHRSSFSTRTWKPAVIGFISAIRDHHADVPLLLISPIFSETREETAELPGVIGLRQMREWLEEIVDLFRTHSGDRSIHYLSGLSLIGPDDRHLMPDGLHPEAEGIRLMGERFAASAPGEWSC